MKLKVLIPARVLLEEAVAKVTAEGANGSFTLLPHHIDFVTALVPGILAFDPLDGSEQFVAIDQGVLVKCGDEVHLSTRNAVRGPDLEQLRATVREHYEVHDDRERLARSAAARLEAGLVRRFMELQRHGT